MSPIYEPKPDKPMNVVVFGSGSGTNLEALLTAQKDNSSLFEVRALFTDRSCRFQEIAEREGIPLITHSFINFFKARGVSDLKDPETRAAYDWQTASLLEDCAAEHQFTIDLIVLAGYMRLLHSPLLEKYPHKIINVHPADLTVMNDNGKPRYAGDEAVYAALLNGEMKTRSTVHLVNARADEGPILVSGPWCEYTEGYPVTREKAAKHQEKQKAISDFPALIEAVQQIAQGKEQLCADFLVR